MTSAWTVNLRERAMNYQIGTTTLKLRAWVSLPLQAPPQALIVRERQLRNPS